MAIRDDSNDYLWNHLFSNSPLHNIYNGANMPIYYNRHLL